MTDRRVGKWIEFDVESTSYLLEFFTSEFSTTDVPAAPPAKSGSPPATAGELYSESWIQVMAIVSILLISLLVMFALLQIYIHNECWNRFTAIQMGNPFARSLFILFFIALIGFYLNSIAFTYLTFTELDSMIIISYRMGYEVGKTLMSQFFVLRLWMTFKDSVFRVKTWILFVLAVLSTSNTIYQFLISCSVLEIEGTQMSIIAGVTTVTDGILMWFFIQRLFQLTNLRSEVVAISSKIQRSSTHCDPVTQSQIIELSRMTTRDRIQSNITAVSRLSTTTDANDFHHEIQNDSMSPPAPSLTPSSQTAPTQSSPQTQRTETIAEIAKKDPERLNVRVCDDMIMVMTKFMVLSLIGIASSTLLQIQRIILLLTDSSNMMYEMGVRRCIDGAINIIVMYLMFSFANPYYYRLCKWCDIGVKNCCHRATRKAAIKKATLSGSVRTQTI